MEPPLSLLEVLEDPAQPLSAGSLRFAGNHVISWQTDGAVPTLRVNDDPCDPATLGPIKLSRSKADPQGVWARWWGSTTHWLHVEVRGLGSQSTCFSAIADDLLLDGLPWQERDAPEVSLETLSGLLIVLTRLEVARASWDPAAAEEPKPMEQADDPSDEMLEEAAGVPHHRAPIPVTFYGKVLTAILAALMVTFVLIRVLSGVPWSAMLSADNGDGYYPIAVGLMAAILNVLVYLALGPTLVVERCALNDGPHRCKSGLFGWPHQHSHSSVPHGKLPLVILAGVGFAYILIDLVLGGTAYQGLAGLKLK